ncbi:MAG: hypothetical protein IPP40_10315 [bacterium]|nr:hypothetical protein [bacterium]
MTNPALSGPWATLPDDAVCPQVPDVALLDDIDSGSVTSASALVYSGSTYKRPSSFSGNRPLPDSAFLPSYL